MNDSEMKKLIKDEVAKQMNILLNGQTRTADVQTEGIDNLWPGCPTVPDRPLVLPYGFAGRAPDGTLNFTARVGTHAGSRYVIGHRDANRPTVEVGESALYSMGTYLVRVFNDKIQIGKGEEFETVVVGDTLATFLGDLLSLIATHTHAAPGSPPTTAALFTQLKALYIDTQKILAKDGGRF